MEEWFRCFYKFSKRPGKIDSIVLKRGRIGRISRIWKSDHFEKLSKRLGKIDSIVLKRGRIGRIS